MQMRNMKFKWKQRCRDEKIVSTEKKELFMESWKKNSFNRKNSMVSRLFRM